MKFVVAFLWLILGSLWVEAIIISPEVGQRNGSISTPEISHKEDREVNKSDSSERNRRLIPYLAYLPAPNEYPISQYYPIPNQQLQLYRQPQLQFPQQQQQQSLPVPNAYVHVKVPTNNNNNNYQQQAFQTIVYGGRNPTAAIKEIDTGLQQHNAPVQPYEDRQYYQYHQQQPQFQHLPTPVPYKDSIPQKTKPLKNHNTPSQSSHTHHSPSKFNLTPFTPSNKVPGHFVPIIFSDDQANNINYGGVSPRPADVNAFKQYNAFLANQMQAYAQKHPHQPHPQRPQQQPSAAQQQGVPYITRVNQYSPTEVPAAVASPSSTANPLQLQHVSAAAGTVTTSSPSPIYHVINDLPDNRQQHHTSLKQQIPQQHPLVYTSIADDIADKHNITPQQKYVMYLQQQLRYKQQQEVQEHQHHHHQQDSHRNQEQQHQLLYQHQHHQQPDQIYIVNPSPSPAPQITSTPQPPPSYQQVHAHASTQGNPPSIPINHVVYENTNPSGGIANDDDDVQYNVNQQQPTTRPVVLHNLQPLGHQQQQRPVIQEDRRPNPNYVEYIVDGSQQEIDNPYVVASTPTPTRPSYQLSQPTLRLHPIQPITATVKPSFESIRIVNKNPRPTASPYGRKPIKYQSTTTQRPQQEERVVYVSAKPKYTQLFPTGTPIKLKPSNKYHSVIHTEPTTQTIPPPPPSSSSTTPQQQYQHFTNASEYTNQYHHQQQPTPAQPNHQPPSITYQDLLQNSNILPDELKSSPSLAEILRKLQESNHLPQTLTPDNIDNSIKTLIKILNNLKESQTIVEEPAQHHEEDYDYNSGSDDGDVSEIVNTRPTKPGPNTGRPGIDYPALAEIPPTSFNCKEQRYKGFFGDPETSCQVWHYCDLNGGQASFLCPNGTIFNQVALTCDWWFNVKCANTAQLYVLNERLYKYILPFTPKFPEDYSGPLVDKYLAIKFKEMEEKMQREKQKGRESMQNDKAESAATEASELTTPMDTANKDATALIDLDDIANNGSIDTYSESLQTTPTPKSFPAEEEEEDDDDDRDQPLSLRPIVVSTTATPFTLKASTTSLNPPATEDNRISVEQVEVIEIKPDGISGHIIPQGLFSSEDT